MDYDIFRGFVLCDPCDTLIYNQLQNSNRLYLQRGDFVHCLSSNIGDHVICRHLVDGINDEEIIELLGRVPLCARYVPVTEETEYYLIDNDVRRRWLEFVVGSSRPQIPK